MRELAVAMIGAGFMGKAHSLAYAMAPVAYRLPAGLRRRLVVDVVEDVARAAAGDFGFEEAATSWRSAVERDDIDVVDIVTPNDSHAEIAVAAAERGKHILCEKPMAIDAPSAERMWRSAERAGVVNMVGFNYRHVPAIAYVRQLIDTGQLGTPYVFRSTYLQDWGLAGGPLVWRFERARAGSGALGDIGSHAIDCAEYLLGEIRRVCGRLATFTSTRPIAGSNGAIGIVDVDDAATFMAEFASGVTGVFTATRHAWSRKNQLAFELDASRGALKFNWDARDELYLALADDAEAVRGFRQLSMGPAHPDPWWPIAGLGTGYLETTVNQLRDFVHAIVDGGTARPNFADGLHVQRVVDAVIESSRVHGWVDVPAAAAVTV
jgi:predicted dehydrogenase